MLVLDGKVVSAKKRKEMATRAAQFAKKHKRKPGLAVVIVGDDPASHVYVRNKVKACEECGIESFHHPLPADTSEKTLLKLIQMLNADVHVDGILVQMPLPKHIHSENILGEISPLKDADGLTVLNMGLLFIGKPLVASCTPNGVIEILKHYEIPIAGKNCVVVGRSQIVGRPMAQLLLQEDATVTIAHSKTKDLSAVTKAADIVVVAAGKPEMLSAKDFKKDAVVIDVGIHRRENGLCGDVKWEGLDQQVFAATPVPGGVGPMTITMLLFNTLHLAELRAGTD